MINKLLKLFLFNVFAICSLAVAADNDNQDEIYNAIIKESLSKYSGACPCPYNLTKNGSQCGKRSAYSKNGGYTTICYKSDVTQDMIESYKKRIHVENNPLDRVTKTSNIITQTDMNLDVFNNYKQVDNTLNKVYQTILSEYKNDSVFLERFKESQRAWIKFRDAELNAIFPLGNSDEGRAVYGSVYPMCISGELIRLTEERVKQLKVWLIGTEEGDVCAGSVRKKM